MPPAGPQAGVALYAPSPPWPCVGCGPPATAVRAAGALCLFVFINSVPAMRFLTFVVKNLIRRPIRSALTVVGLSVAICAVVALVGIAEGFKRSFLELYQQRGVDLVVLRAGASDYLTSTLDQSLEDRIQRVPGVKSVTGGQLDFVSFEDHDLFLVNVNGWEPGCFLFDELRILEGRKLHAGDRKAVMLGTVLAKNLGKHAGDRLELYGQPDFEIVGVFESFHLYENSGIVMPLAELQRAKDQKGRVTGFTVIVEGGPQRDVEAVQRAIQAIDRGLLVLTTEDYASSTMQFRAAEGMAWLTSAVALIVGAIGMLNTMAMSVFERTGELGLLRAVGWRKSRVVRMILAEAEMLSLSAAVLGTLAARVLTRFLANVGPTRGLIEGRFDPDVIARGFLVAVLLGLVGALYPAMRAARLAPTEALRNQ